MLYAADETTWKRLDTTDTVSTQQAQASVPGVGVMMVAGVATTNPPADERRFHDAGDRAPGGGGMRAADRRRAVDPESTGLDRDPPRSAGRLRDRPAACASLSGSLALAFDLAQSRCSPPDGTRILRRFGLSRPGGRTTTHMAEPNVRRGVAPEAASGLSNASEASERGKRCRRRVPRGGPRQDRWCCFSRARGSAAGRDEQRVGIERVFDDRVSVGAGRPT